MTTHPEPAVCELRLTVDTNEPPLAWAEHAWPGHQPEQIAVGLIAAGVAATLVVPISSARAWAGELFSAVAVAYREATGDPHALTDAELAELDDPDAYDPGPGVLARGEDDEHPARVRFHIALDIRGQCLSTADLRAAVVEHLAGRFNVAHLAVSSGDVVAGRVT
jgi:hypothetical protein